MRILVVDDDEAIRTSLRRALALDGHDCVLVPDGTSALQVVRDEQIDAVVLDWGLPDLDGIQVCRRIRTAGDHLPILMLTARSAVGDRIHGLDAGADDFLGKPFEVDELLARVRALLRRSRGRVGSSQADRSSAARRFVLDDLVVDEASFTARRAGRVIDLTPTEFRLLAYLLEHAGTVLGRGRIMAAIWNDEHGLSGANLDACISHIRRKTEVGGVARLIHTVRGVGYVARDVGAA